MSHSLAALPSIVVAALATACFAEGGGSQAPEPVPEERPSTVVCSRRIGPEAFLRGERVSEIVLLDTLTLGKTVLTRDFRFMPTASPDGTRIVHVRPTSPSSFNLFEMDLAGREIRQLTFLERGVASTPAYSPDGWSLLYSAEGEVWRLDLATLGSTQLTVTTRGTVVRRPDGQVLAVAPNSHHASFTADGHEIVYASTQSGHVQVWKMNRDGSEPRQLTDGSHGESYPHANVPHVSRGSDRIVFWSGIEGNFGEVWSMDRDGADARRLTETPDPGNSDDPFLSPDASRVVFGRGGPGVPRGMYLLELETGAVRSLLPDFQWCNWLPGERASR